MNGNFLLQIPDDFIITIDGPAGVGKTTTAQYLSNKFGFNHIIVGYIYRSITYGISKKKVNPSNFSIEYDYINAIPLINKFDFSELLFSETVKNNLSLISSMENIRNLVNEFIINETSNGRFIVEGRNVGKDVLPNANLKFFLTAQLKIRASRRANQIKKKENDIQDIQLEIEKRDKNDRERKVGKMDFDSSTFTIDNTLLTFEQQIQLIISEIKKEC